jgi:hypothetical protein
MNQRLFSRGVLGLLAVAGALLMGPAAASAAYSSSSLDTSTCGGGDFSQHFSAFKDSNWYTPAPGTGLEGFASGAWQLSGGAKLVTTTVEGSTATILDLPSGAKATSPRFCVTNEYPRARAVMRNAVGGGGISFRVAYEGTPTWQTPKNTGQMHGDNTAWTAASPMNLQPYGTQEWQPMRIVLEAQGTGNDYQVDQLWIDPRLSH